jgi:hypothetical protein
VERKQERALQWITVFLLTFAAAACPQGAMADQYVYSDDFSTDKATVDSYWHSEFLEDLPDPWPDGGFLRYEAYLSDPMLSFYYGAAHDAYAWLRYEFPLEGGTPGASFASGEIQLELVSNWGAGWIQCACFADQSPAWEWPAASELGPHSFEFVASVPPETVLVWFRGCDVSIDDLVITLHHWTPVEARTWSRIKHMFGGPPN